MMKTKEELEAAIAPLQSALAHLREKEERARNEALVGRCFKYLNSYGRDRPRWWLYVKVTGSGKYWPSAFEFQTTCEDEIIIKNEKCRTGVDGGNGYIEIKPKEFEREWKKLQKRLARTKP